MKLNSMTSVITKSALVLAACASLNATAGTAPAPSGKEPAPMVEENGALFDTIGATLEVGWDSRYYFRGLWFADNAVWSGLSISIPLTEQLSLGFGALYTSTAGTDLNFGTPFSDYQYRELDLTSSLTFDAGFAKFGLVYTHYEFLDGFSGSDFGAPVGAGDLNVGGTDEIGLTVALPIGPLNFYAGGFYDFNIHAYYLEAGLDFPIEVTSWLTLVPAVKAGYGLNDYYAGVGVIPGAHYDGFTHLGVSLSAPIKLTKSATLTPYVAWNISGRTRGQLNQQDSEVYGGVKLGVTF
jgi:hypothetical protein